MTSVTLPAGDRALGSSCFAPSRVRIVRIAAAALQLPAQAIDPHAPLVLYGMDSLGAVEIAAALETEFRVELTPSMLVQAGNVAALEVLLGEGAPAKTGSRELMALDSVLPYDIEARGTAMTVSRSRRGTGGGVLLTGASGFVGVHLLERLLRHTRGEVKCLVRDAGRDGTDRLRRRLARLGIAEPEAAARVQILEGDLGLPRLGLTEAAWEKLAGNIGAIYHAAANVNWVYDYEELRDVNVLGTRELLRLACRAGGVPFHFLSSMAVCYSTRGPREVDETDSMLPHLAGIDLGYAQSKCVAEELVREAGRRGLPVGIHRPSLVAGDSRSGDSNNGDIVAALIKGCIQMRCAPDLDWVMDLVPVDYLAEVVVRLSRAASPGRVFHIANLRARHWRECVLWMRLRGYPLQLTPYREWARRLEAEADCEEHALRHLRPFFSRRVGPGGEFTLPELYEESRRSRVRSDATLAALAARRLRCPPLDSELLDRYFESWMTRGFLASPGRRAASRARPAGDHGGRPLRLARLLHAALRRRHPRGRVRLERVTSTPLGGEASIVSELTSWRCGRSVGLSRCRLEYRNGGPEERRLDVVVKVKPADKHVIAVGESLARLCDDALGAAYARFRRRLGLAGCHVRELAIYAQRDPRFRRHMPALLAARRDDERGEWVLVLEHLDHVVLANADDDASRWRPEHVAAALRGIAELQAVWYGRERELRRQPWLGHVQSAAGIVEMAPLWEALAAHARPMFATWAGPEFFAVQERSLEGIGRGWRALEAHPRTLIHNDFNPRNVALRRDAGALDGLRLCAYDWELATLGAPQHDLAEFLCFVLGPGATRHQVDAHLETHRRSLARAVGVEIDPASWRLGFRASLDDLLINRLPLYALVHRVRKQRFLPRVVRTWRALDGMYPERP